MKRAALFPLLLALGACVAEVPPEVQMPEPAAELTPDPDFRLTASQRERLAPAYDLDAMEALLALYSDPDAREVALDHFLAMADGFAEGKVWISGFRILGDGSEQENQAIQSLIDRSPSLRNLLPQTSEPD